MMAIHWNEPLQTRHDKPKKVDALPDDGVASRLGKRRGFVHAPDSTPDKPTGTVYLYDENGRCNCSGKDSPFDLVNVAVTLAKAA